MGLTGFNLRRRQLAALKAKETVSPSKVEEPKKDTVEPVKAESKVEKPKPEVVTEKKVEEKPKAKASNKSKKANEDLF